MLTAEQEKTYPAPLFFSSFEKDGKPFLLVDNRIYKLSAELMEFYIARKTSAKCGLSSEEVHR
ncbi:hypothetical protein [Paenibacillus sp. DMB20]|uniref:hypothetical protein n=1 Tax=Paenibacillus sp. DMB20 TaxID=1642570 RepID=UPI0006275986|nr:hypothetical protein [Paenibacillus sp. DMB20]KKO54703.1 hypothetical protein XI25_05260 [Paenibacillus sp. DMB20]